MKPAKIVYDYALLSNYDPQPALQAIAEITGLNPDDIAGHRRHQRLIGARHVWWACIRTEGRWSYPEIGAYVERDHTTVMRAIKRVPPKVVKSVKKYMEAK